MSSPNPPGAYDSPPSYEDEVSQAKNAQEKAAQPTDYTAQITIDHGLPDRAPLLTTILVTPSTTYEDFQRQVKARYVELPRSGSGSFIWSTWLWGGSGKQGESEDRTYVNVSNWETTRIKIIRLSAARSLGWKGRPCRLETVFRLTNFGQPQKARNERQLERMMRLHEANEKCLLMEGRHMAAPSMRQDECVLM